MLIQNSNARTIAELKDVSHFKHVMEKNKGFWRHRLRQQFGFDVWKLPVCEKCEGWALWHKDGEKGVGACRCGHITKNPITVEEYYTQGYHIDRTGMGRDQPVILDRKFVAPKQVSTVYAGEADLRGDPNREILIARS